MKRTKKTNRTSGPIAGLDYDEPLRGDKQFFDLFYGGDDVDKVNEIYAKYKKQAYETQGFDIDVCPPNGLYGVIRPIFNHTSDVNDDSRMLMMLSNYSRISVDAYNKREGSDYTVNLVVKAGRKIVSGYLYYITFEATNSKHHLQVFQSMVYQPHFGENKVVLVRRQSNMPLDKHDYIKELCKPPSDYDAKVYPTYLKQLSETQGFDIDVYPTNNIRAIKPMFNDKLNISAEIYYMLSDCSRIALDAYNQHKGTHYSVNRVVKSCTQAVNAGTKYFITFEGKNSEDIFKIFQATVFHSDIEARGKEVGLVRPKATGVMPSDKHSNMMKDLVTPPRNSHHAAELWETYLKQIKETEGFDIDVYPTNGCGVIQPMFNDTSPVSAETYNMLSNCSRISVDAYNKREGTDYTVNRVVKVCTQVDCVTMYFITFEANSKDHFQVFQAITGANKVLLVRPKSMDILPSDKHYYMMKDLPTPPCDASELWETYLKQIKETEGFDIDVYPTNGCCVIQPMFNDTSPVSAETYKMLIDCSMIAVDVYSVQQVTHYTLYQVVKACTQALAAGRMYFITFKAISNDGLEVLQAKVFEPPKGQNEVLLVRLKA